MPNFIIGAVCSAAPAGPWQTAQFTWYALRPRSTDSCVAGTGFASALIAPRPWKVLAYMNSGADVPYSGTEPCGFARGGVLSLGVSHGSYFGCCLKSVNHEHPASETRSTVFNTLVI